MLFLLIIIRGSQSPSPAILACQTRINFCHLILIALTKLITTGSFMNGFKSKLINISLYDIACKRKMSANLLDVIKIILLMGFEILIFRLYFQRVMIFVMFTYIQVMVFYIITPILIPFVWK